MNIRQGASLAYSISAAEQAGLTLTLSEIPNYRPYLPSMQRVNFEAHNNNQHILSRHLIFEYQF